MNLRGFISSALVGLSFMSASLPAVAERVGVAAAVEPDAFSSLSGTPNKQLNIGKSIFYNERINTTASGLVQVLLVDGSTFTVGPHSNLVIDKFVYDPKKKTGEIVATFSKGAMRFVGGKLSKNDDGVRVNTPDGSLSIRGGIVQAAFGPDRGIISFIYGEYAQLRLRNGQTLTAYEPGNTIDTKLGRIRPTTAADINFVVAALSKGGSSVTSAQDNVNNNSALPQAFQLADVNSIDELISDANTTNITGQILRELEKKSAATQASTLTNNTTANTESQVSEPQVTEVIATEPAVTETPVVEPPVIEPPVTEPPPEPIVTQKGGYAAVGVTSTTPSGFVNLPSESSLSVFDSQEGTVTFSFDDIGGDGATSNYTLTFPYGTEESSFGVSVFNNDGILYENSKGTGTLTYRNPQELCTACGFMEWGEVHANVQFGQYGNGTYDDTLQGFWVSGNIANIGDLPVMGTATYAGTVHGNVISAGQGPYSATGALAMEWDFAQRAGTLDIINFDNGALNLSGTMSMPGQLSEINKFSGDLSGSVNSTAITGGAAGSFAAAGNDAAAGVLGSWNARNSAYQATGVFGGAKTSFNPNGSLTPN